MAVDATSQKVDVHFFGDHERCVLEPRDCRMYSKVRPNTNIAADMKKLEISMNVSDFDVNGKYLCKETSEFLENHQSIRSFGFICEKGSRELHSKYHPGIRFVQFCHTKYIVA